MGLANLVVAEALACTKLQPLTLLIMFMSRVRESKLFSLFSPLPFASLWLGISGEGGLGSLSNYPNDTVASSIAVLCEATFGSNSCREGRESVP